MTDQDVAGPGESVDQILWSDESIFQLIPGSRVIARRRVAERFHPDCVVSTVKHGGGSIQVWGGRLNASAYTDLISPTSRPILHRESSSIIW